MLKTVFAFIVIFFFSQESNALTGQVVSIAGGDTITVLDSSKKQHKIRLYGIDCPEKSQAFGAESWQYRMLIDKLKRFWDYFVTIHTEEHSCLNTCNLLN